MGAYSKFPFGGKHLFEGDIFSRKYTTNRNLIMVDNVLSNKNKITIIFLFQCCLFFNIQFSDFVGIQYSCWRVEK